MLSELTQDAHFDTHTTFQPSREKRRHWCPRQVMPHFRFWFKSSHIMYFGAGFLKFPETYSKTSQIQTASNFKQNPNSKIVKWQGTSQNFFTKSPLPLTLHRPKRAKFSQILSKSIISCRTNQNPPNLFNLKFFKMCGFKTLGLAPHSPQV